MRCSELPTTGLETLGDTAALLSTATLPTLLCVTEGLARKPELAGTVEIAGEEATLLNPLSEMLGSTWDAVDRPTEADELGRTAVSGMLGDGEGDTGTDDGVTVWGDRDIVNDVINGELRCAEGVTKALGDVRTEEGRRVAMTRIPVVTTTMSESTGSVTVTVRFTVVCLVS